MPKKEAYDLSWRPATYWTDKITPANVKGQFRREQIQQAIAEGTLEEIPEAILADSLSDEVRDFAGRIHPSLMGGEYLPDFDDESGEVEIARLVFASVTCDVTSVRARLVEGGIAYRVINEYDYEYRVQPEVSDKPLTLGELIHLIDTAYDLTNAAESLLLPYWEFTAEDGDFSRITGFITVSSEYYGELSSWYDEYEQEYIETRGFTVPGESPSAGGLQCD